MDTFTSSADPLDQEIAAKEADVARGLATITEVESQLLQLKQSLEVLTVEVRTLKRAAGLRPSTASRSPANPVAASPVAASPAAAPPVAARPFAPSSDIATPAPQIGRFRDVVDQIRAGR